MAKPIVIYRACSVGNPNKHRPKFSDKDNLIEFCFNSFISAFEGCNYDLVVLLDRPSDKLRQIVSGKHTEVYNYGDMYEGNIQTFHRQLDIALEAKQPFLFVEDDYYFTPNSGYKIIEAVKELPFITPYDHPGYYTEQIHQYKRAILALKNHHWGSVISTTLTFGGQYDSLLMEVSIMKKYGWADHPMWVDVTSRIPLYASIPSLATHMEVEWLAPVIQWSFS